MNSDVYNTDTGKNVVIFTNPIKFTIIHFWAQMCSIISQHVFSLTDNINEFKSA